MTIWYLQQQVNICHTIKTENWSQWKTAYVNNEFDISHRDNRQSFLDSWLFSSSRLCSFPSILHHSSVAPIKMSPCRLIWPSASSWSFTVHSLCEYFSSEQKGVVEFTVEFWLSSIFVLIAFFHHALLPIAEQSETKPEPAFQMSFSCAQVSASWNRTRTVLKWRHHKETVRSSTTVLLYISSSVSPHNLLK